MWRSGFLLAAFTACVVPVTGYSNGKVYAACGEMVPQHGYEARPDPAPYSITVDKSTFSYGDNITVSLQVASSTVTFFKGFLIEARDAGNLSLLAGGFFILTDPRRSQLLQCGQTQGSGVSHRSSAKKTHMQAVWQSPKNPPQRVQFLVTVVHEYKVFWVRIASPVVSLSGATAAPVTAAPVTAAPPQTTSPAALTTPFSSVGCGHSKSCLRDPVGCHPQSDPHCFFLSFTTDEAGRSVMFELSGPAEGYVSFALSLDKWMGNDDVYLCVNDGSRVTISPAYVSGRKHPELAKEDSLWDKAWRLADGVIQCRFRRNFVLPHRFNLNQSYFLFLAHGKSDQGLIHRHSRQPLISTSQVVITGHPEDLSGSRSPLLIKFHGVLMLTVWMWIVSTAVLIARHYKHLWPDTALLGQRPWFQLHRTMMVLAVILTGVAFTLPFIYRRGWSKRAGAHPYLGCAVMALCVIQPIMAIVRPAPESSRRIIFNWLHFGAGTAAQILAAACMFLGAAQQALLLPSLWCPALLTGWLLWIVLVDLLLLIHSCRLRSRGNTSDDKEKILFAQLERRQHGEISQVKKTVLVVFLIGNTGFLTAFIKAIGSL
ncbi:putative ferric-chelate reductase 1 isoform X2 [Anabas testudineus]|uniref:Ferric-chelate reductase 1b n=2 Tax=Anabas testudineus TaxID=64144 RepID=A0A3Q1J122_ANATE|nr:putative ferric-chelate reductase 1 isoform X2 [Anabas testudineus]XP_026218520.1 putative ferric-chelate reductase 1 isoform X2 [Anabas testudineus]XP_026218521.1 putative ferric-chelate reductase 1 isoform X2 [Anabas testudineus]XP_026218522.1 putative ferric-chelate reductase 1 isoform X2 [Anabas testudineus]XP_026218523.1 putative ferric-chelate reductase 1 isoform X2 [Anabas testudineus]